MRSSTVVEQDLNYIKLRTGFQQSPQYPNIDDIDYTDIFRNHFIRVLRSRSAFVPKAILDRYGRICSSFADYYLEHNGDPNFNAPTRENLRAALRFLDELMLCGFRAPYPMIHSDGTLGVFWRRDNWYASIDFSDEGHHIWGATDGENTWTGRTNNKNFGFNEQFLNAAS